MVSTYTRKDSCYFWLQYGPRDRRTNESSKIRVDDPDADYKLAKKINKIESRLLIRHAGSGWDWVPKFFELHYRNSAATLRIHRNAWNWIAAWLRERGIKSPDALTSRADVLEYAEWRMSQVKQKSGRSPARNTALYEMRVLGRVMNEAVLRDMAEKNPAANLGLKRDSPKPKPEILPDEQATILDALRGKPDWMREPFRIALQSGLRWHEMRINLRRDVDWQRQRITIPDPKGGVTRAFTFEVMQLSLLDHLQAHARGHRQFPYVLPSRPDQHAIA